ncbi:MAG: hypothetical protein RLY89_2257 [Bacteroidota bacterium]|jgi:hypothetical protein
MSNNQIILPDFVIANLYGNNLVVGNDVVAKERTSVSTTIPTPVSTPVTIPVSAPIPKVEPSIENQVTQPAPIPTKPAAIANQANANPVNTTPVTNKPDAAIASNAKPSNNQTPFDFSKQWFLGNNGKQITVMVKEETVPYINDNHLQFLSNVLSACKLNLGDIALVNYKNFPLGFDELKTKSNPKIVLAFDISPKELKLPFTIPVYQVQDYAQCRFLFAPSLTKMEGDSADAKAEKTKLWNSLKILFQL